MIKQMNVTMLKDWFYLLYYNNKQTNPYEQDYDHHSRQLYQNNPCQQYNILLYIAFKSTLLHLPLAYFNIANVCRIYGAKIWLIIEFLEKNLGLIQNLKNWKNQKIRQRYSVYPHYLDLKQIHKH